MKGQRGAFPGRTSFVGSRLLVEWVVAGIIPLQGLRSLDGAQLSGQESEIPENKYTTIRYNSKWNTSSREAEIFIFPPMGPPVLRVLPGVYELFTE